MRVTRIVAVVLVLVGGLAAFIGNLPGANSGTGPSLGPEPTGAAVVITSLPSPSGSTPVTVAGVTLDLPKGFTSTTTSGAKGIKHLAVHDPSQTHTVATVTITPMLRAGDAVVDTVSRSAEAKIAAMPGWSGLSLSPATWTGFPYATAIRGTLTHDDGSRTEMLLVNVRDRWGTKVVGVSTNAAYGQLEGSAGFAILRTMRFSGPTGWLGPLAGPAGEALIVTAAVMLCGVLVGVFVLRLRRYRTFTRGLRGPALVVDVRPAARQRRSATTTLTDTVVVATAAMPRGVPVKQKVPHGQYHPGEVVPVVQALGVPGVVLLDRPDLERPTWMMVLPLVLLVAVPFIAVLGLAHWR